MCRHLAHVGPEPVTLASLVTEPPHSLLTQSYAPADMRGGGTVNADGFGVGWVAEGHVRALSACCVDQPCPDTETHARGRRPTVYRNDRPMWTDASFLDLVPVVRTRALLGAVRSATVGMPVSRAACAPFVDPVTGLLFSHNGVARGWPDSMAGLAGTLPALDLLTLEAATDSALLWALLRARLAAGADLPEAIASVVVEALAAAPGSRLNLLVVDTGQDGQDGAGPGGTRPGGTAHRIVATAVDHALSFRTHDDGAVTVASEPVDDHPAWRPVPDGSLLVAHPGRPGPEGTAPSVSVRPLPDRTALSPVPDRHRAVPSAVNAPDPRT